MRRWGQTAGRTVGRWLAVVGGAAALAWWAPGAAAGALESLAYEVRIVRYAATGNAAAIEGNEDTPQDRQDWLDAIGAALAEASGFFRKPTEGTTTETDEALGTFLPWSYPAVTLQSQTTEEAIGVELAKVTWVVASDPALDYGFLLTDVDEGRPGGAARDPAAAIQMAYANWSLSPWDQYNQLAPWNSPEYGVGGCMWTFYDSAAPPCEYWAEFFARTIVGWIVAPESGIANPVPAGNGNPPAARVAAYYLGRLGGTAAPGASFWRFAVSWPAGPPPPGASIPPAADCVDEEPGWWLLDAAGYWKTMIPEGCTPKIEPPKLPDECPACTSACSAPPSMSPMGGPSCTSCGGRRPWSVSATGLEVGVRLRAISLESPRGPQLGVDLQFREDRINTLGDFGYGWATGYDLRMRSYGTGIRIVETGNRGWWFVSNGDGTYEGPPSTGRHLVQDGGSWIMTAEDGAQYAFDGNGFLISITNRYGETLTITHDAAFLVESITGANGDTLTFTRNTEGLVTAISEPGGRSATFAYDENGFLTDAVDMGGRHSRYEYGRYEGQEEPENRPGPITKLEENVGTTSAETTTFTRSVSSVDGQQELTVTDPEANVTLYRWDHGNTEVTTRVDPNGGTTSELRESIGGREVVTARIDANEGEWTYEYNTSGFLTKETDPLNQETTYTRNSLGHPLTETRPGNATTTCTYAANGQDLLTQTDPLGETTTYTYDTNRNLTSVTNPTGETTSYTYDSAGRKLTETAPSGQVTSHSYNTSGQLVSTTENSGTASAATTTYTYNTRGLSLAIATPDGLTLTRTYDDLDRVLTETRAGSGTSATSTYSYGCCGLEQVVDANGATTRYEYDLNHRRTAVVDHFENRTEFEYDGNGNQTVVRDALDQETVTEYDAANRPVTITHPDATTETFEYDALGRQVEHTDAADRTQVMVYDARGNAVTSQVEVPGENGPVTYTLSTTTFDLADRPVSTTNAAGLTVTTTYDDAGRAVAETYPDTTTVTRTYNTAGQLTAQTDRLGQTTAYTYDAAGRVATVTDPQNRTTTFTYTPTGKQATVTDALNQVTAFSYDHEGRLLTTTYPDNTTETRVYSAAGLLTSQTDRTGKVTSFTYDAMGRRLTSAAGGQTLDTVTYDTLGRVATQTDSRGVTVTMTYDAAGRVTRRTMPDATHEDFTYGPNGVLTHADRAGRTTTYTYDALGRRASETNPNSGTLAYGYNLAGQMTSLTDASSNVTQWAYDTEGRLVTKTYADNSTYTYTYDAAGRLLTRTDAMNRTTTYSYDAAGRLLSVDYPDTTPDVTYTYDALGRRLSMADGSGTSTWTYDPDTGQPATVDGPFAADTLSYTWDAQGRRLTTAIDGTALATYTYDTQGRMATVTGAANEAFTYSYLGNSNQVTGLAMPGGLSTTKTYDSLGRLSSVANAAGNVALSAFTYTVDNGDHRTRVDLVDGGHWDYSYDNAGQLTGGTRYGPKLDQQEGTLVQYAYQYDAMGNPTQRSEDAGVSAYTFNNLNQLVTGGWSGTLSAFGSTRTQNLASVAVSAGQQTETAAVFQRGEFTAKDLTVPAGDTTLTVTRTAQDQTSSVSSVSITRPQGGVQFVHDLNGNLLGDGTWAYTWDCENRLVAAERAAATRLTFVYDGDGRRRVLSEYCWQDNAWGLTLERRYTWDGWLPVHEVTTDYATTPATTQVDVYVRGLDLSGSLEGAGGIGGMLAVVHDGTMLCYFDNGRGDITELADPATGGAAAHYEYDPFGRPIISAGPVADLNRYRFSSKEQDPTGLNHYGRRYYGVSLGRWASRDSAEPHQEVNLLCFALNRPVTRVDPLGNLSFEQPVGEAEALPTDGAFMWTVKWKLDAGETDGWIVQEVTMTTVIRHCTSPVVVWADEKKVYYEAWQVKASQPYKVYPGSPSVGDTFAYNGAKSGHYYSRGLMTVRGVALFYAGSLPPDFTQGRVPEANGLRSTEARPTFWPASDPPLMHLVESRWERCPCKPYSSSMVYYTSGNTSGGTE